MVKVALVVSIIALAVCLLTALHGVLSDGLKVVLCQEKVQIKYNQFSLFM